MYVYKHLCKGIEVQIGEIEIYETRSILLGNEWYKYSNKCL